ncbi:hypothetical protein OEA41_002562 [Lepraria neglecta]|uniref:Uncharacterized protein n=1 Tax=Lepraria neglecta TaxID=209136 RepID=A0AAD9ZBU3_9LECA|nr:hypothetical protein OEA41_002562 [Lepraria neglecta]
MSRNGLSLALSASSAEAVSASYAISFWSAESASSSYSTTIPPTTTSLPSSPLLTTLPTSNTSVPAAATVPNTQSTFTESARPSKSGSLVSRHKLAFGLGLGLGIPAVLGLALACLYWLWHNVKAVRDLLWLSVLWGREECWRQEMRTRRQQQEVIDRNQSEDTSVGNSQIRLQELQAESRGPAELPPAEPPIPTRRVRRPAFLHPPTQPVEMGIGTEIPRSRGEGPLTPVSPLVPDRNPLRPAGELGNVAAALQDGPSEVSATPPPYGSHPGDLPPLLMRSWDYEAAQTEEPIPAPNTTVGTGERLYLSPEELNGRYNSIPQNMVMPDLNQLDFPAAQPENDAASPQDRLAEELAGLRGVLNAIEADLPATAPDQETTLREGPLADLPASPHGSLNLVGPAVQATARDQEAAQTDNLNVDPIEGPRLSVVSGMSYAPGDDILDTARDDTGLEQSRDHAVRQANQSGQTPSSAPPQQPADDCIVTNWKDRSTLRTAPALIDTHRTLDPECSPPLPAPQSAFSSSSSSGNDDDEAPCPQNFQDMPEDGEPEAGETVKNAATEYAVVGAATEEAAEQAPGAQHTQETPGEDESEADEAAEHASTEQAVDHAATEQAAEPAPAASEEPEPELSAGADPEEELEDQIGEA